MADVAHSGLTTTDLHEPKDVAAATIDQVYVADGAASGDFTDLHPKMAIYSYQESDGVDGEAYTTGWAAININTETSDPDNIGSVASKAVTIGAGTWLLHGWAGVHIVNAAVGIRIRLQNITDATTIGLSPSVGKVKHVDGNDVAALTLPVFATFTLSGNKAIELQGIAGGTNLTTGQDDDLTAGAEVYAQIIVHKLKAR